MNITKPQKSIYDMEKFSSGSIAVICTSFFVKGKQNEENLQAASNELFRINDALRMRIIENSTGITQYVQDFHEQDFEVLHFEDMTAFVNYADVYAKDPIELSGQLCEIKIVILPDRYGLLVKIHHIISDAWTVALLATQFNLILKGEKVTAYSYLDYCDSEKNYLESKRYLRDKEFFLGQLKQCEEPAFISEKKERTFDAARKVIIINTQQAKKIRDFAEKNEVSVFSIWATVLAVYMGRLKTDSEKFFIGTTVLNRYTEKDFNTAGMFINTVPVLLEANFKKTFIESLEKTEDTLMSVFRHQKYNYEDMITDVRKDNYNCDRLYDIILSYMNATIGGADEGVSSTWHHNGRQNESLQINFDDRDNEGIFKVQYDYQTEKFTQKDIDNLHSQLCNLLFDAIENPGKKIADLEMLSDEEKQKLLCDFNNTKHSYAVAENSTLYSLFEKTASYNKDKICIKTAERNLTFGELLNISESLDTKLRKITGKKKSVIAVIAERSVEMYCAIYGIIRGGNAYLPIDPNYPQERIDRILTDSKAAAVAAQGKFTKLAGNVPVIDMTEFISDCHKECNSEKCAAEPDDTAYVIYTSGSTGNPKGAMVSHRSAVNRILWMHDKYPLGDGDVIFQKTPYTFDVSVWELFWWGICGGSLAASKPDEHFLPAKILDEVKGNKVTHLHFVPSVFEIFLSYLESHTEEQSKFNTVKYVFVSGEALTANLVERFYKLYSYDKVTLHNLYGPTECAVDVTYYDCRPEDVDPVPIGKPIYNTQMYVVDKSMKAVPIGVTGELCIAGVNVGKGYLGRPELTAEKFVDNPFGEGKLYRTGDNAYFREDGQLIFCGRIDSQIKLNGQRIEIGEIESAINEAKGADSAAVIVRKVNSSDVLVAFYTGFVDAKDEIKNVCMSKLPKYMVPGAFIHLDKLPLNQSGKLDRKALSEMQVDLIFDKEEYAEPTNPTESFICEKFKEVLGIDNIGRNSDFFENGGTSLSMISLLSEKIFEGITAAEFMRNPAPAKLASVMDGKSESKPEYLEALHIAENSDRVLILLPFAGGGAEAYGKLLDSLKKRDKDFSVYFVRYLHSEEECRKAASEIAGILKGKEISVYSHCVGAAIALRIIKTLEENGTAVKEYFAAAAIPPSRPSEKNMWRAVPDRILEAILSNAGAHIKDLSKAKRRDLLTRFREDTDFANNVYADFEGKIKTPVSVIISKDDIFTKNYRQAEKLWLKYVQNLKGVSFVSSESHYFQRDDSDSLSDIILASDK